MLQNLLVSVECFSNYGTDKAVRISTSVELVVEVRVSCADTVPDDILAKLLQLHVPLGLVLQA